MAATIGETWTDVADSSQQLIGPTQAVREDVAEAKIWQRKRGVAVYFSFKNRVMLFGALFVLSSVLTLIHDTRTLQFYNFDDKTEIPVGYTDIIRLSIGHVESPSDVSAAVCFKTLFGDIDLGVVIEWAGTCDLLIELTATKMLKESLTQP